MRNLRVARRSTLRVSVPHILPFSHLPFFITPIVFPSRLWPIESRSLPCSPLTPFLCLPLPYMFRTSLWTLCRVSGLRQADRCKREGDRLDRSFLLRGVITIARHPGPGVELKQVGNNDLQLSWFAHCHRTSETPIERNDVCGLPVTGQGHLSSRRARAFCFQVDNGRLQVQALSKTLPWPLHAVGDSGS